MAPILQQKVGKKMLNSLIKQENRKYGAETYKQGFGKLNLLSHSKSFAQNTFSGAVALLVTPRKEEALLLLRSQFFHMSWGYVFVRK